jgi:hypothetical protein
MTRTIEGNYVEAKRSIFSRFISRCLEIFEEKIGPSAGRISSTRIFQALCVATALALLIYQVAKGKIIPGFHWYFMMLMIAGFAPGVLKKYAEVLLTKYVNSAGGK